MQFAGQRTDSELRPIGEAYNMLVRLSDDTLPSPEALMVTGISPQQTVDEGYTEAEFARLLMTEIFTPDTIVVGFNNIRFDDEFIRHLLWRTFYDPYEWAWRDGRSRWDMLDVVRMTRALRPTGIVWPVIDGKPTNRLELLSAQNGLEHTQAHDALSDVTALIAVAQLIRDKQPQLFDYLLSMREKSNIKSLVNLDTKQPFVYTSGRYDAEHEKTTVAFPLTAGRNGNIVVYDLRVDPSDFVGLSSDELSKLLFASYEERQADGFVRLPVKELQYNRAPAVAPLGVLEQGDSWERIHLSRDVVEQHQKILLQHPEFAENIRSLYERVPEYKPSPDPEAQLYDSFVSDRDALRCEMIRGATEHELADLHPEFIDERLDPLLLHYKARNYPRSMTESEIMAWEKWRGERIARQLPKFMQSLQRLSTSGSLTDHQLFIIQELQLWAESIIPSAE